MANCSLCGKKIGFFDNAHTGFPDKKHRVLCDNCKKIYIEKIYPEAERFLQEGGKPEAFFVSGYASPDAQAYLRDLAEYVAAHKTFLREKHTDPKKTSDVSMRRAPLGALKILSSGDAEEKDLLAARSEVIAEIYKKAGDRSIQISVTYTSLGRDRLLIAAEEIMS